MHAATAILVLCLVAVVLGEPCPKRPTPFYDCDRGPSGIFFPHPEDCTFLVVCIGNQPVVVSLCEETDYRNVNDPKYSLGCPKECAQIQPTDCEIDYKPTFPFPPTADPTTGSETATHVTQKETQPEIHPEVWPEVVPGSSKEPPVPLLPTTTAPQTPDPVPKHPPTSTNPWLHPSAPTSRPFPAPVPTNWPLPVPTSTQRPYPTTTSTHSPNTDPHHLSCKVSGIVVHPYDCMKAFVCPSVGIQAILFNICENVSRDSTFPVGCPEMCPGWLPGVMSVSQAPHPYSVAI